MLFGVPYGRGADAIARQCREEGIATTLAEAQALIDYYFERYPGVRVFLDACKQRVITPGWMQGVFGRYRRFGWSSDPIIIKDQERQAGNFPIQNLVADAIWTALANLWDYRAQTGVDFKFKLQIHDAILLQVPFAHVPHVYREVFTRCMTDQVPIWPCDLNGRRLPLKQPYHLVGHRELMFRWSEDIDSLAETKLGADHPSITSLLEDPTNDKLVVGLLEQ